MNFLAEEYPDLYSPIKNFYSNSKLLKEHRQKIGILNSKQEKVFYSLTTIKSLKKKQKKKNEQIAYST
jgi:hypothetical protein